MRISPLVSACLLGIACSCGPGSESAPVEPGRAGVPATYPQLPLSFEANCGQHDPHVRFLARTERFTVLLTPDEVAVSLPACDDPVLRMRLHGARANPVVNGVDELAGKSSYFVGADASRWLTGIATYERVRYEAVYPGISMVCYGTRRHLEYDFIVAPGADPGLIVLEFEGQQKTEIDDAGSLVLHVADGRLIHRKPVVYQEVAREREEIAGRYVRRGEKQFAFEIARYDPTRELVIDPQLIYSTYLDVGGNDQARAVAVDRQGNAYVVGETRRGKSLVFVTKLDPTGSAVIYSVKIGGSDYDFGIGIAVDGAGNCYVTGETWSTDFPLRSPFIGALGGRTDAFVSKLDPSGTALVYSTYLGGSGDDRGQGITVAAGHAYVTGEANSADFPLKNPYQASFGGPYSDVFLTKFDAAGSGLIYSTYLGGADWDSGRAVAVDDVGNAYLTGVTWSADFPLQNPLQPAMGSAFDAFVAKFDPSGTALVYSTYLGGDGDDWGHGIAVDAAGAAHVTGETRSTDFPTKNPFQPNHGGGRQDAFVSKLDAAGARLSYSTYLGGSQDDVANGIAVDNAGNAYVTGKTGSPGFPLRNPLQPVFGGSAWDAFLTRLGPGGSDLVHSTFLGGSHHDEGRALVLDGRGATFLAGYTGSTNFPVRGAYQSTLGVPFDAVVCKIDPLPSGAVRYGVSTPPCQSGISVKLADSPKVGSATFAITSNNGPPTTQGVLLIGVGEIAKGTAVAGINLYVDPLQTFVAVGVVSDARGYGAFPVSLPMGTAGARFFAQFVWPYSFWCAGAGALYASDAMAITVQP